MTAKTLEESNPDQTTKVGEEKVKKIRTRKPKESSGKAVKETESHKITNIKENEQI